MVSNITGPFCRCLISYDVSCGILKTTFISCSVITSYAIQLLFEILYTDSSNVKNLRMRFLHFHGFGTTECSSAGYSANLLCRSFCFANFGFSGFVMGDDWGYDSNVWKFFMPDKNIFRWINLRVKSIQCNWSPCRQYSIRASSAFDCFNSPL